MSASVAVALAARNAIAAESDTNRVRPARFAHNRIMIKRISSYLASAIITIMNDSLCRSQGMTCSANQRCDCHRRLIRRLGLAHANLAVGTTSDDCGAKIQQCKAGSNCRLATAADWSSRGYVSEGERANRNERTCTTLSHQSL